jgi:hypothetical protein
MLAAEVYFFFGHFCLFCSLALTAIILKSALLHFQFRQDRVICNFLHSVAKLGTVDDPRENGYIDC